MATSAGGSATNSGIDFQQRIAALAMAHILCGQDEIPALHIPQGEIKAIAFETGDAVDDLTISGQGFKAFIQAKRTISMSDLANSEFASVIDQFVNQFLSGADTEARYILATSPASSARITKDLRKVTTSARLNENWSTNPLTENEKDVLDKTYKLIRESYRAAAGRDAGDGEVSEIFRDIYVAVLDIEDGGALEQAIYFLLAGKSSVAPQLLWSALIALGLTLARDRQSLDSDALRARMGDYLNNGRERAPVSRDGLFNLAYEGSTVASGREILLVDPAIDETDLLIAELRRFSDDGRRRISFADGEATLPNGIRWKVVGRFSTFAGCERYAGSLELRNKKIVIWPINSEEDLDGEPYALAHSELCHDSFKKNPDPLSCLNCGDPISEDLAPLVEVDEVGLPHSVGLVHQQCVRPTDRVIGGMSSVLFKEHALLKNFNYEVWYEKIQRGQGVFRSTRPSDVVHIGWQPHHNDFSAGRWCVRIDLEDGSSRYITERARVARRSKSAAEADASEVNEGIAAAQADGDPLCYSKQDEEAPGDAFAPYSLLIRNGYLPVQCVRATAASYTRSIGEAYSAVESYYAPLAYLTSSETGDPVIIDGVVPLLTNPLEMERYVSNWSVAGIDLGDYTVSILASDERFDRFISLAQAQEIQAIVDPLLDPRGRLVRGYIVRSFPELSKNAKG